MIRMYQAPFSVVNKKRIKPNEKKEFPNLKKKLFAILVNLFII